MFKTTCFMLKIKLNNLNHVIHNRRKYAVFFNPLKKRFAICVILHIYVVWIPNIINTTLSNTNIMTESKVSTDLSLIKCRL